MRRTAIVVCLALILSACGNTYGSGRSGWSPELEAWADKKIEENWDDNTEMKTEEPIPEPNDPDALVIKGHRLTASLRGYLAENGTSDDCFRIEGTSNLACLQDGLERGRATFAGAPADLSFEFYCEDPEAREKCRLFRITATFDTIDFDRVADAMNIKFGEPDQTMTLTKENPMGAEFGSEVRKWTKNNTRIEVEQRGSKIDEGIASFLYLPKLRDVEKGRRQQLQPEDI